MQQNNEGSFSNDNSPRGASPRKGYTGGSQQKTSWLTSDINRDFTCVCESIKAEVLFLSYNLILPIMKMHGNGLVE